MAAVEIPPRGHLPAATLHVNISTPSDMSATSIEPNRSTVVFVHPLMCDGMIFVEQFDDPAFHEHFNLVAVDLRGHGQTEMDKLDGSYGWKDVAEDLFLVLQALGASKAHFVSAGLSSIAIMNLALLHPEVVLSMVLLSPAPDSEDPNWTAAFEDIIQAFTEESERSDQAAMRAIVASFWEVNVGNHPQTAYLREHYLQEWQDKGAAGSIRASATYIVSLLRDRTNHLSTAQMQALLCPCTCLVAGHVDEEYPPGSYYDRLRHMMNNGLRSLKARNRRCTLLRLQGLPAWAFLPNSDRLNPLIYEALISADAVPPSPVLSTYLKQKSRRPSSAHSLRSMLRHGPPRSTSRSFTGDSISLDKVSLGPEKASDDAISLAGTAEVEMTVEVRVTVEGDAAANTLQANSVQ